MDKKRLQLVWWLCMLPSFAATSMFYYEWMKHGSETILLAFAIICLLMGVLFGSLIVWSTSGAGEKGREKDRQDNDESQHAEHTVHPTQTMPVEVHLKVQVEQAHSLPAVTESQTHFDHATIISEPKEPIEEKIIPQEAAVHVPPAQTEALAQSEVEEVLATDSDLSKLFVQLSDTVANAQHKEDHACPSDRWTTPVSSAAPPVLENRSIEELLNHADVLIAQENFDEALKIYDSVVKVDANNFDAWFLKAVALRKKNHCQDAIYCINFALSIKRTSVVAMVEKGECLLQLDRADQAIVWFDKALSQDKIAIAPWIGKARCLVKLGETSSAIACYDKVLSLQPDHVEAKSARAELASKVPPPKKSRAVG